MTPDEAETVIERAIERMLTEVEEEIGEPLPPFSSGSVAELMAAYEKQTTDAFQQRMDYYRARWEQAFR